MATMTTSRKRNLPPVSGLCKWVRRPGQLDDKSGLLEINGTGYYLIIHATAYELGKADGTNYFLPLDLSSCDCPDATYNAERPGGGCKHRKALAALLAAAETVAAVA
jgi:hypothetical protein